jgi:uncharacterized protein YbcI
MDDTPRSGDPSGAGRLNAALARAAAHCHAEYRGRGPQKAQAFFHDDVVVILMYGGMTKAEQSLVDAGSLAAVQDMRRLLHGAMHDQMVLQVEQLTGRGVTALMTDSHTAPDMSAQVFILDAPVRAGEPAEAL